MVFLDYEGYFKAINPNKLNDPLELLPGILYSQNNN